LEEPPGDALMILIALDQNRLLATIRSRCQILKFNFVSQPEMEEFARVYARDNKIKLDETKIKEIAEMSFGRPGRMVDFLSRPELAQIWRKRAKEFASMVSAELPERFAYAKKITDDETTNLNEIMEIWQFHFRRKLLEALNSSEKVRPFQEKGSNLYKEIESSRQKENSYTPQKIADSLKKIHDLSVVLQTTNASPRLAIENFLLEI
jgi:DNA polymerase-3 subunit delta'